MTTHNITSRQWKLQVRPTFGATPENYTYSAYWVATIEGRALGLLCNNPACHPHENLMAAYIATTKWAGKQKVEMVQKPLNEILHSVRQ